MSKSHEDNVTPHSGWGRPLGRTRAEEPQSGEEPPGPAFDSPPPEHPMLRQLHALWISATDETISSVIRDVHQIAAGAPPEIRPWVQTYVETVEGLRNWLRDR